MKYNEFPELNNLTDDDTLLIQETTTLGIKKVKLSTLKQYIGVSTPVGYVKLTGTPFGASPSYAAGSEFDKAFDGNTNTFFDYLSANGGYTGLDLGSGNAAIVKKIRFYPRATYASRMLGGKFQGSNNIDGTYTDLHTISGAIQDWNEIAISNATAFRYLRYLSPENSYGNVSEIEFYK